LLSFIFVHVLLLLLLNESNNWHPMWGHEKDNQEIQDSRHDQQV